MAITTCIFDAYGTLFDVAGAARLAAAEPGQDTLAEVWPRLAESWRRKQLEYTWLRTITGDHADFDVVTGDALDWAMEDIGLRDAAMRARLLALYRALPVFPEVPGVLARVKARLATAILSNGTPETLAATVAAAGIGRHLDDILSVESLGVYKPDPRVYALVCARFGCRPGQVLFVSSNGWDVAGAARFGFVTAWINRAGLPEDRMPHRPGHILPDLAALPQLLETL